MKIVDRIKMIGFIYFNEIQEFLCIIYGNVKAGFDGRKDE